MFRARIVLPVIVLMAAAALSADNEKSISLSVLGSYASGTPSTADAAANPQELPGSEIAAYDPASQRLFITNVFNRTIDIVSIANPSSPALVAAISVTPYGAFANSVAVHNGLVAVAVEASPKTDNGKVVFFDASGGFRAAVTVGALPDMLTFTPNGKQVVVANEGEPSGYGQGFVDPEGSVSIINLPADIAALTQSHVTTADFTVFNNATFDSSVRIFGPGATVAQDLEPEYITVSQDSKRAWVTLQENNAVAEIDLRTGVFVNVFGLGLKEHSFPNAGLDGSDQDGPGTARKVNIATWPLKGMHLPDAIASYQISGQTYLLTANEGDVREWPGIDAESSRLSGLTLAPGLCSACKDDENGIGRLTVSRIGANAASTFSQTVTQLLSYGTRSFSIWTDTGAQVFDSGDQFEQITSQTVGFNSNHNSNASFDTRSDDKGPEPEGVTVAKLWGRWYAFIVLERVGGIMVYDVTTPAAPRFIEYVNNRDFAGSRLTGTAGDLGPEASFVIPEDQSPTGVPLLVVANEVSGTTTMFQIRKRK